MLVSKNSVLEATSLHLIDWKNNGSKKTIQLTRPERVISYPVQRLVISGGVSPASFYYGPSGDDIKPKTVPLIVMPHGGK